MIEGIISLTCRASRSFSGIRMSPSDLFVTSIPVKNGLEYDIQQKRALVCRRPRYHISVAATHRRSLRKKVLQKVLFTYFKKMLQCLIEVHNQALEHLVCITICQKHGRYHKQQQIACVRTGKRRAATPPCPFSACCEKQ